MELDRALSSLETDLRSLWSFRTERWELLCSRFLLVEATNADGLAEEDIYLKFNC
jgi:hypothetical protein